MEAAYLKVYGRRFCVSTAPESLEVNASPGFRVLLEATGVNAMDAMFEYIAQQARAGNPKRP